VKKIEFFGAGSGEVTGSCYLITAEDTNQALVDFGMFQGSEKMEKKNFETLPFSASGLQGVFITHAHLDHTGRLPLLVFGGFKGKIYMTGPTKSFVEIILNDSARIAEKEHQTPLYTSEEVWKVMNMIEVVEYDTPIKAGSFTATFRDAGHILGSASIEIVDESSDKKDKIVFSGDLGNTPQSIVKPTQYIDSADYVVMESTYGSSAHPDEAAETIIQEEINAVEKNGGVLLIPAFALERTQEILHIIHHLKKDKKVREDTPVFLDSPMGIDATAVYMDFKEYYNDEIKSHETIPFNFEGLVITDNPRDSKDIIKAATPKVIVAGSGMMSGGRILHHALSYLGDSSTRVLFVGYQAEETLGREIISGIKTVVINKETVQVRAHIREMKILSSHADLPRLLKWVGHIKGVKKVFLTHGELPQQEELKAHITSTLSLKEVYLPQNGEEFSLSSVEIA